MHFVKKYSCLLDFVNKLIIFQIGQTWFPSPIIHKYKVKLGGINSDGEKPSELLFPKKHIVHNNY